MVSEVCDATFQRLVLSGRGPVLVDFWADWCRPCRNQDTAASCAVRALPTVLLFRDGQVVARLTGLISKDRLVREIEAALSLAGRADAREVTRC